MNRPRPAEITPVIRQAISERATRFVDRALRTPASDMPEVSAPGMTVGVAIEVVLHRNYYSNVKLRLGGSDVRVDLRDPSAADHLAVLVEQLYLTAATTARGVPADSPAPLE